MIKPDQVKKIRKSKSLTQVEFAKECGISVSKLRLHWEVNGISEKAVKEANAIRSIINAV